MIEKVKLALGNPPQANLKQEEMNVKQLKEQLNKYPDDMDVFIPSTVSDYDYGIVNTAMSKEIRFYEEGNDEVEPSEVEVLILTED